MEIFNWFINISRPLYLSGTALSYLLGVGIIHYLGIPINTSKLAFGLIWVILISLSASFLAEIFSSAPKSLLLNPLNNRHVAIIVSAISLSLATSLSILILGYTPGVITVLLMTIMIGVILIYSIPPLYLINSAYGELYEAIYISNLVPTFAFLLQAGNLHRFSAMSTFPLLPLYLALVLIRGLSHYSADLRAAKLTMAIQVNWKNAIRLHHALILSSYLILALAGVLGLPLSITAPVMASFPLGLIQIYLLDQIEKGARPNWKMLSYLSIFTFGIPTYLLAFSFWIR